jgi:hypothetical protein
MQVPCDKIGEYQMRNTYPTHTIHPPQVHIIEDRPLRIKAGVPLTRCGKKIMSDWADTDAEATCRKCLGIKDAGWHGTLRKKFDRE